MEELKQKLAEKTVMFWIRMILRFMAWVLLTFMTIYTIVMPVINGDDVVFSTGVKQVYFWCGMVLLAIELIKKIFELVINRYGKKDSENG